MYIVCVSIVGEEVKKEKIGHRCCRLPSRHHSCPVIQLTKKVAAFVICLTLHGTLTILSYVEVIINKYYYVGHIYY